MESYESFICKYDDSRHICSKLYDFIVDYCDDTDGCLIHVDYDCN